MKKIIYCLFISFFIICPVKVLGASIVSGELGVANGIQKIGDEFEAEIVLNHLGLETGYDKTLGISEVLVAFAIDDEDLLITSISSDGFNSELYKTDDYYYIESIVDDSLLTANNSCAYGSLFCGDYKVKIRFYVKNTQSVSTNIEFFYGASYLLDFVDLNNPPTEDDGILLEKSFDITREIKIRESDGEVKSAPQEVTIQDSIQSDVINSSVIEKITPPASASSSNKNNQTNNAKKEEKSNNAYLKELSVEGYSLSFDKDKKEYEILIEEDVNSLNIVANKEDSKSSLNIIGADNLKESDYKVTIEVVSENGNKNTYTIKCNFKKNDEEKNKKSIIAIIKDKFKNMDKKTMVIGLVLMGVSLLSGVILFVIRLKKDHKMNKLLDRL